MAPPRSCASVGASGRGPHTIDVVGKIEGQNPRSQAVHLGFHQLVIRRAFQAGVQHALHARHALQVAGHCASALAQWRSTRIPSPTVRFAPAICVTFMSGFVGVWKFTWRGYARARLKSLSENGAAGISAGGPV